MIVVRVELWPFGDEASKREIARAEICNVGGSSTSGEYTAKFFKDKAPVGESSVGGYPRLRLHVWHLVYRALHNLIGNVTS